MFRNLLITSLICWFAYVVLIRWLLSRVSALMGPGSDAGAVRETTAASAVGRSSCVQVRLTRFFLGISNERLL